MDSIAQLADALRCLPGVGPKSAQRMVYHLLLHQRQRGLLLAECLQRAMHAVGQCKSCNNFTEAELCAICEDPARQAQLICVVESPSDIAAIEQSHSFQGRYFVLNGKISPLDGLGPEEIGLPLLKQRVEQDAVNEIIIALSPSVETQATIHFIQQLLQAFPISLTQLAHGIPSGGELEFMDGLTISSALKNRAAVYE